MTGGVFQPRGDPESAINLMRARERRAVDESAALLDALLVAREQLGEAMRAIDAALAREAAWQRDRKRQ